MKLFGTDLSSRVILGQALLVGASVAAGFMVSASVASAVACGGIVAIINTLLLSRSVYQAFTNVSVSATGGALALFSGLVVRLMLMTILFGVGFAVLKLDPLPFILGFVIAQSAYGFGGLDMFYKATRE